MPTDHFLLSRMREYFEGINDPWDVGFDMSYLSSSIEPVSECYSTSEFALSWTPQQHAGRILFLMTAASELACPISLDCYCDQGHIYAEPIMIDGWHRYFAHLSLGSEKVPVNFGGLLDLADYLRGDTDVRPE